MKDKLSELIDFLQNREGLFLVLAGALIVQAPHSAEVFHRISTSTTWSPVSWIHAAVFAAILEVAVLLFVIRGRKELSWCFAGISVLMNVFYYYNAVWWTGSAWANLAMCIVTSVALPLAIAFYSHEVADDKTPQPASQHTESTQPVLVAQPEPAYAQPIPPVPNQCQTSAKPVPTQEATDTPDKRYRAQQLRSEGLSYAQIAQELDMHRNTIANWLKQTNGHTQPEAQ